MSRDEALNEEVLVALRQIIRAIGLHSKKLAQQFGLTGPQIAILKELEKYSEISVGNLAKNLSLSSATVTGILDRLIRQDMVFKRKSKTDKRCNMVSATEKGKTVLENSPSLLQEKFLRKFIKLDTWEQNLILSTLQRVATMMNAEDIDAAPILASGPLNATKQETLDFFSE